MIIMCLSLAYCGSSCEKSKTSNESNDVPTCVYEMVSPAYGDTVLCVDYCDLLPIFVGDRNYTRYENGIKHITCLYKDEELMRANVKLFNSLEKFNR